MSKIFVTKPSLAPLNEVVKLLEGVWERGILTHNGPLVQELEAQLKSVLGLEDFIAVSNGTIAIQMAVKALSIKGEIITSPFTWVATLSAIQWEGCTPVFAEIDPATFNIDPKTIEDQITDKTVAIMPIHVFGNPCDVEEIDAIAKRHGLKVIYDAAHAIGSTYKGQSLLRWGDISATSLHATKLLNTAEGGGCITNDEQLSAKLKRIRFFGHDENKEIVEEGFNGKLTEIHAALGIANLKYYDLVLKDRKDKYNYYKKALSEHEGLSFQVIKHGEPNYSYFPVIMRSEKDVLKLVSSLNERGIFPRRYFWPAVNTFEKIIATVPRPISESISERILCLPLYWGLEYTIIDIIIEQIKKVIK